MTAYRRRLLSIALVLAMLLSLVPFGLPAGSAKADDTGKLGMTTKEKVNVRYGASTDAKLLFQIPQEGYVGTIKGEKYAEKIHWYRVEFLNPDPDNDRYYTGYVNAEFFRVLTDEEAEKYKMGDTISTPTPIPDPDPDNGTTPTPTPAPEPTSSRDADPGTIGTVTNGGVNLRKGPSTSFGVLLQLNRGDQVTVLTIPNVISDKTFYFVRYGDVEGFIMSTFLRLEGSDVTPTPTPANTPTPTPTPAGVLGYVMTIKGGVNLRQTPGGTVITEIKKYQTLPILLEPRKENGYTWYFVQVGEYKGFVRGDCVKVVTNPTPTPTATSAVTPTPTPKPTATGETPTGYLKTTAGGVNLRKSAGYTDVLGQISIGTVLPAYGSAVTVKGVKWYKVYSSKYGYGYLHGNFVAECDENGNLINQPTPTPSPTPSPTPKETGGTNTPSPTPVSPDKPQAEASYNTLKLGSTGNAVKNLITELINQGFYSGSVGTKYTSAVEEAVRKFQKAKGLTADGIAGPATQHALYGTVPIGSGDYDNLEMTLYPAEKIDWYTGGIQELWTRGSNYKVYDVKTGIVWWAHRWAGGNHADVETLTAADTARFCRMYGVSSASQINSTDHWQRRPCLVTIGTRTFACSLYGVPHNPSGDTISDNNMTGQVCIHFTNSRTTDTNRVDNGHQEAIEYAWLNAPNGHK